MGFEDLSPEQRADRYRAKANEQMELARNADTAEICAACLELAAMWTRLAEAAERGGADYEARRRLADDCEPEAAA